MAWKDYETLDVTRETTTEEELEKLRKQLYRKEQDGKPFEPVNKGGRADVLKKRYS